MAIRVVFSDEYYAEVKALKALRKSLNRNQRRMFDKYQAFGVTGGDWGRDYLIAYEYGGIGVSLLDFNPTVKKWYIRERYCVNIHYDEEKQVLPWPDRMLAYKKMIEAEGGEEHFRHHANSTGMTMVYLEPDFML